MDCHTLLLTEIKNNITNLQVDKKQSFLSAPEVMNRKNRVFSIYADPPLLKILYLKSNIDVDMIKIPYGCNIIRF